MTTCPVCNGDDCARNGVVLDDDKEGGFVQFICNRCLSVFNKKFVFTDEVKIVVNEVQNSEIIWEQKKLSMKH